MAERVLGPFKLGPKLGGGGMGVVYRATYAKTGQVVALKLLPAELSVKPRLVARFERELAILKKLKHPNIVPCFGGGKLGEQQFMAMELVEGGSLAAVMKKRGRIPWEEVITIGVQICSALEHAHEHGIIHRDLKPSNLLITKDGKLKLADFGIARDNDMTALTAAGRTVGTFAYMAPEQIKGGPDVTHKADLYALGCVLYELLTGTPPFAGENAGELLMQHMEKKPVRVTTLVLDCPVWLDILISQLLEKDPEKRPRDAATVSRALTEVEVKVAEQASMATHAVSGQPTNITAADGTEVRKLLKKKKRKKGETGPFYERVWFLASCLLALILGIVWLNWPEPEEKLLAKATALMESDKPDDWKHANRDYLSVLQRRFPEGKSASAVQQYIDKIEMYDAEEKMKFRTLRRLDPTSEGERLYSQARQYEVFGDRITAYEKYESMIRVLGDAKESRPFANLARRQMAAIDAASDGKPDRVKVVTEALQKAEDLYKNDNVMEARKMWNSIISLYEKDRELKPQVRKARARLAEKEDPDAEPEESEKTSG
jgi:serine/threonine protein kinase